MGAAILFPWDTALYTFYELYTLELPLIMPAESWGLSLMKDWSPLASLNPFALNPEVNATSYWPVCAKPCIIGGEWAELGEPG